MSQVPDLDAVIASLTPEQQKPSRTALRSRRSTLLEALPPATQIDILDALEAAAAPGSLPPRVARAAPPDHRS